jgi:hypothetical protein
MAPRPQALTASTVQAVPRNVLTAAKEYVSPLRIAILSMRTGNMDKPFAWLNRAVEDRNAGLVYLTPFRSPVRRDCHPCGAEDGGPLTRRLAGALTGVDLPRSASIVGN